MIRVLLADDQVMVRSGLAMILGSYPDISVIGEVGDGVSAVEMATSATCDVVLMDIRMPVLDGIAATARIKRRHPELHVLVLTTFDRTDYLYEALQAGAEGFLLKSAPPTTLVEAVRMVAAGDALVDPVFTKTLISTFLRRRPAGAAPADPRLASLTAPGGRCPATGGEGNEQRGDRRGHAPVDRDREVSCARPVPKARCARPCWRGVLAYEAGLVESGTA